jgi:hypothetical protein
MPDHRRDLHHSDIAGIAFALALGGCALSTRHATMIYPPAVDPGVVATANASTPTVSRSLTIALEPFVDRRKDTTSVGTVRNALGMKTAPVEPTNSVTNWVDYGVKVELANAGFTVIPRSETTDTSLVLGGGIDTVYADAYLSYSARVSLFVRLTRNGKEILAQNFDGKGSGGTNVTATSKSYAQTLSLALQDALRKMVDGVNEALLRPE